MRLDKMDLNLFVVFDAIYREGSVTKVAVLLNITQPAVSNNLSRLRQIFDDPLFVRSPAGMKPTPVADAIIGDVREALSLLSQSMTGATRFDPARTEKTFNIGMTDLMQAILLPRLTRQLASSASYVSINSYSIPRDRATEELKAGMMDLLIDAPLVNAKELRHRPVATMRYVAAMRKRHPLSRKALSMDAYLAARHLHVSSRRSGRGQVDVALHALGQQRQLRMRLENYLVAGQVCNDSDLLWSAPEPLTRLFSLSIKPLPFDVEPLSLNLYWSNQADKDPANQWLREQVAAVLD